MSVYRLLIFPCLIFTRFCWTVFGEVPKNTETEHFLMNKLIIFLRLPENARYYYVDPHPHVLWTW